MKHLVRKSVTILLPKDKARDIKLDIILKENSKENKDNNAAKLKDNIFNTSTTLEKCINLTTIVEESENGSHF